MPVYSGGLGVLAGDHLKSASDLGLPLVGVSLMYREGYFRQYLNVDGWQQERYPENDFFNLPLIPETERRRHAAARRRVPLPGREVSLRVWRIQVGRVPLYLLDANIPQNTPEDRDITAQLYGGDHDTRIQQEIILGIGGIRALQALGKEPTVCHMNEGHSAFCGLERIRVLMEEHKLDFATASEAVKAGTVLHDAHAGPGRQRRLPAAHDRAVPRRLHAAAEPRPRRRSSASAGSNPTTSSEPFGMTVLAHQAGELSQRRQQAARQRVAARCGRTSGPSCREAEVPITSITNGVHTQSWLSPEIAQLYDRYLGMQWEEQPTDFAIWKRVEQHPRRRAVADARARPRAAGRLRPARGCRRSSSAAAPPPAEIARGRGGARPGGADHRLRPPVRHLQARRR